MENANDPAYAACTKDSIARNVPVFIYLFN